MKFFIFSITLFSQCFMAYCNAKTNLTLPFPHMVIVGNIGVGKSCLAMALIGEDVTCDNCTFPICWDSDSCTNQTSYAVAPWLGNPDNQNFTIVETPGFSDSDGDMDELLEEMINVLNDEVKSANAIILAIDSTAPRFEQSVINMLGELETLFGKKMWNNTIIEMTKFSYEADEIEDREEECVYYPKHCYDESYWYKEMNKLLEEMFHIGMELPMVFIDCWSQKDKDEVDPIEEEHFINETQKLWDFAMSHDAFEFKRIDEVLDENEELRIENEKLNATVANQTETIKDLKDELDNFLRGEVRAIYVKIADSDDSGCDDCNMELTIYSEDGNSCETDYIDSSRDDWERASEYVYTGTIIGNCNNFEARGGVKEMLVTHHGDDAVSIDHWKIDTDLGLYYCPGEWYDNGDSRNVTCSKD